MTVVLTEEYKKLFARYDIDITENLKSQIVSADSKDFFTELIHLFNLTMQMRNSITGNVDVDYLISPVRNANGEFYDSRNYENIENPSMPQNADANGAYNIARKGLWAINQIKNCENTREVKLSISNKEWLEYAQKS